MNKDCIPWEPYHLVGDQLVMPSYKMKSQKGADAIEKLTDAIYRMMGK